MPILNNMQKLFILLAFLFAVQSFAREPIFNGDRLQQLKDRAYHGVQQMQQTPVIPVDSAKKYYAPEEINEDNTHAIKTEEQKTEPKQVIVSYVPWEQYHNEITTLNNQIKDMQQSISALTDIADMGQTQTEGQKGRYDKFMDWTYTGGLAALIVAVSGLIGAFAFRKKLKSKVSEFTTDYDAVADHIEKRRTK